MPTRAALSTEQAAALDRYRARWLAIRRSTASADRGAAEEGLCLAYEAAGLPPPVHFVWCDSPIMLSHRSCAASAVDGANVRSVLIDRMRRRATRLLRKRLGRRIAAEIASAVNPNDALIAAVSEMVLLHANQDEISLRARLARASAVAVARPDRAGRTAEFYGQRGGSSRAVLARDLRICPQRARPQGRDRAAAGAHAGRGECRLAAAA